MQEAAAAKPHDSSDEKHNSLRRGIAEKSPGGGGDVELHSPLCCHGTAGHAHGILLHHISSQLDQEDGVHISRESARKVS